MLVSDEIDSPDFLPQPNERILLVNPAIFDIRLHWAKWLQPTYLLKLAAYCKLSEIETKLIDMLFHPSGERLHRELIEKFILDGSKVNKWRFGDTKFHLIQQLKGYKKEKWCPTKIYIECFTTFWWEGAVEAAKCVREIFPDAQVLLVGAYPTFAANHVREHIDFAQPIVGMPPELATQATDLSLYAASPNFSYLSLESYQTVEELIRDLGQRMSVHKIQHFAFVEHDIAKRFPNFYPEVLERVVSESLRLSLYALGNISPSDLVEQPALANKMRRAGYKQIHFSDDRAIPVGEHTENQIVETYKEAAARCREAGFAVRSDALTAGICLGRPGEDLAARARLATRVTQHIGSIILWPYQPTLEECPEVPLELQNGKLFPFRFVNRYSYRDYLDVMGLAVVLNSKYRTNTFDFLGGTMISRFFCESLTRQAWEPASELKGSVNLPVKITRKN